MGHIDLAVAGAATSGSSSARPAASGSMLDMTARELERVIYYEDYLVIDEGEDAVEAEAAPDREANIGRRSRTYGEKFFVAKMGAEAIRDAVQEDWTSTSWRGAGAAMEHTRSQAEPQEERRRGSSWCKASSRPEQRVPEWMILEVLPVIPPDLRPLVPLEGGRFATSDLNDLYRRVINRNNRLAESPRSLKTPEVIIRNEKRMLQEAVDALIDNGRHGRGRHRGRKPSAQVPVRHAQGQDRAFPA
jgi:DNA-directed RNA polymerase subunit beta'